MKIIKRFSGLLLAFVLLAGLLPADALAAPVTTYDLKINGVQVTSDNWMDVLHNGTFLYQYNAKTLIIDGDCTLDDGSPADTMIESSVDGLTIMVMGNFTLTMNNSSGTFLKLNGDTTITTTADRHAGSLTLWNNSPGGTGILVNDCSLTLDYLFDLDIGDVDYGILGQGDNAALKAEATAMKIDSSDAAISGFSKGLEILKAEILTPPDGKASNGSLCDKKGNVAASADIRNTAWADALTDTDEHNLLKQDLNLSTLGEWDPGTETYKDYDIDLMELYNAVSEKKFLTFYAFNLIQGSVPPGMSLVIGPSNKRPDTYTALRLRGRPTKPGSFVAGVTILGKTDYDYSTVGIWGNLRMAVNYEPPKPYDLWIDGFQVNSSNLTDITDDGAFSYDPGTNTLTVHKSYDSFTPNLIKSQIDGLIVNIPEGVTLSAGGTVFQLEKNTRFKGSGQLTVKSTGNYGIQVKNGAFLNIRDADLAVSAAGTAVAGSNGGEKLSVTDARLSAKGGAKGVAGFSGGISLTEPGVAISEPPGGKVSGGSIVKSDDSDAPEVLIAPVKTYDLYICSSSHPVTEANRKDVLGDGVFSFDGDKTLHIKGDCTSDFTIINSGIDGLVIAVDQDSVLAMDPTGMGQPMFLRGSTTITGPGSLTLSAVSYDSALESGHGGDLTLKDLVLTVEDGNWGIQGGGTFHPNKLIVENSSVRVSINNEWNTAIQNFAGGIELTGCEIIKGKVIDAEQGQKIVNADGTNAKEVTISPLIQVSSLTLNKETMNLAVGGSETLTATVTPENASLKTVSWSSSNPAVAEVDGSGKVTGKSKGEAVITAKSNGGPWTKSCKVTVTPPVAAAGVTLNKTTLSLPVGNSDYLTPTVSPSNATDKTVSWQSDKPDVAKVDADGKVTAVAKGKATITVKTKDGSGKTAKCEVTVTDAVPVDNVKLNKTKLTIPFNGSGTLTATVSPANASNKLVTWSSDNPAVAVVNGAGKVTAVSNGTANITVKTADGGKTASCAVTVEPQIHVKSVKLDQTKLTLVLGQYPLNEGKLTATVSPADATFQGVTWKSSDPSKVYVYHGTVTAKALGTADITATTDDGGKTATCKVTVIKPKYVTGISLDRDELSLGVGETTALTPTIKPADATNKLVTWESNKPAVASVDSYGAVTGKSAGTAIITAKTVDGSKTAVCSVTVSKVYEYAPAARAIKTYDLVTSACPLIVASYDANGRYLRSVFFTGPNDWKTEVIKTDAKTATIMWIDLATGRPKIPAQKVTLS